MFGTDTAALNTLDDYEEGTFTPTVPSGITNPALQSASGGTYVKVGNLVRFAMDIRVDSGTPNGDPLRIGGLPFTARSGDAYFGDGTISYGNLITNLPNLRQGHVSTNTDYVGFYDSASAINGNSTGVNWVNGRRFILSGTYQAA